MTGIHDILKLDYRVMDINVYKEDGGSEFRKSRLHSARSLAYDDRRATV